MIVELHDRLQKPLVCTATRLLVCAEDGTPIGFFVEFVPGHYRCFRAGDPDFNMQLKIHNIDRTVVVNPVKLNQELIVK